MRISYEAASFELQRALTAHGFGEVEPQLAAIEPPRAWGLTTNVCFLLGSRAARDEIAEATRGLSKKEAKQVAGRLAGTAGEQLAAEIAADLHRIVEASETDPREVESSPAEADVRLPYIAKVEAEGAYINFYYDAQALTAFVVRSVLREEAGFGRGNPTGKRIMVEYAQPNTHKDFHVGHLRNASIGQAIANLLERNGSEVLKATYIGDVGAHVAKAIWGHQHRHHPDWIDYFPKSNLLAESDKRLLYWGSCYRETEAILAAGEAASADAEDTAALVNALLPATIKRDMAQWLKSWEEGNPIARAEWKTSRDECIEAFGRIFSELRLEFDGDYTFYESTIDDTRLGQQTAAELKDRGIAIVDESEEYSGALYVDFDKQANALRPDGSPAFSDAEKKRVRRLGKMTILRSDGTSLYQTKELGLAKHKFDLVRQKYGEPLAESLYVVGAEQKLYFEQVFAILRLWDFPNADHCRHISYELVVLPEGKMSSREGTIVSYRELRDEAVRRAEEITREKCIGAAGEGGAIDESKVRRIAREVAIAAIKFAMLSVTGSQQIVFDFESALSFSGRAAPYLQYAYARAGKLVGAADEVVEAEPGYQLHPSEAALARVISA
ncbi:MAG TPA: arginine--tRNA ligase, partial [Firmicutes bacterium]|nr:arginine--tRNA ligase [Bacillota bacterium]